MATDIYRPARDGGALADRRPVLLHRTPYEKVETEPTSGQCRYFAAHGYVVVSQVRTIEEETMVLTLRWISV